MAKKQTTVTLDTKLLEKIKSITEIAEGTTVSGIIETALEEFFDEDGKFQKTITELEDEILIPINKYKEIFNLKGNTIYTHIKEKKVKLFVIGGKKYIKLSDEDLSNLFARIKILEEKIKKIEKELESK